MHFFSLCKLQFISLWNKKVFLAKCNNHNANWMWNSHFCETQSSFVNLSLLKRMIKMVKYFHVTHFFIFNCKVPFFLQQMQIICCLSLHPSKADTDSLILSFEVLLLPYISLKIGHIKTQLAKKAFHICVSIPIHHPQRK